MNRILMTAMALSIVSCRTGDEVPPPCGAGSIPVETVSPRAPAVSELQVRGSIVATVVVEEDGRVTNPVITRSQLEQLDRGKVDTAAYESAVLIAVEKWRFSPVPSRCAKKITIDFRRLH